jgi:hypothetical protein
MEKEREGKRERRSSQQSDLQKGGRKFQHSSHCHWVTPSIHDAMPRKPGQMQRSTGCAFGVIKVILEQLLSIIHLYEKKRQNRQLKSHKSIYST